MDVALIVNSYSFWLVREVILFNEKKDKLISLPTVDLYFRLVLVKICLSTKSFEPLHQIPSLEFGGLLVLLYPLIHQSSPELPIRSKFGEVLCS